MTLIGDRYLAEMSTLQITLEHRRTPAQHASFLKTVHLQANVINEFRINFYFPLVPND